MKNLLVFLLFVPLVLGLAGCQVAQSPSTPSVTKYTSFLGVTLGMSASQVENVLGTGTYFFTQTGGLDYYSYSGGNVAVGYVSDEAKVITAWASGYEIEGITVGSSYTFVVDRLESPSNTVSSTPQIFVIGLLEI